MATELVGIELRLKGYEGVMSDMRMLDTMLNNLRGRRNRIEIQSNLAKAKRDVIAYRAEVERLNNLQKKIQRGMDSGVLKGSWGKRLSNVTKDLENYRKKLKDAQQATRELQYALSNLSPKTFGQVFGTITSWVAHAGSAMQSFGNALTKLTSPFRRFTTGLIYSAGYKMLNTVLEGFGGAFERYDTMQNYAKSLKALGLDAEKTFKVFSKQEKPLTAIDNLNEAVLGLPTGLDEIVAAQKVYAGATGEMVKSTKAAIAANNTFLASSMGSREQRFMQKYLVSLASGAELTTTQWQSMGRIAPLAMRAVAKELKYADNEYAKFNDDVQKGRVSGEQFLDAFIKVGTEGKVQAAANVMKTTYEGLVANIQNATKRMGEGVLKMLDDVFKTYNGRNLVQNLLGFDAEGNEVGGGIKHFINSISDGLQGWVKAHPEEILNFFNAIKSIDWKSLIRGVGEGFLELAHLTEKMASMLDGKDLSQVGKFMVMGNVWGRVLTISGGLIKGTRHIWGFLGATAVIGFLKAKGFAKYGLLGMLGRFIGGTAEGVAETATVASTAAATAPKVGKVATGLSAIFKGWVQLATMVGGTALVGWGSMKLLKSTIKTMRGIGEEVKRVDWESVVPALKGFGIFMGAFLTLGSALGQAGAVAMKPAAIGTAVLGVLTTMVAGFAALDMRLVKSAFKSFADSTKYLNDGIKNLNKVKSISDVGTAKTNIKNAITTFNQLTEMLEPERNNPITGKAEGKVKTLSKSVTKTLSNLSSAISSIKTSIGTLNEISGMKVNTHGLTNVMPQFESALDLIGGMLGRLPEGLGTKGTDENISYFNSIIANFRSALDGLVGENGILTQIPQVIQQTTGYAQYGVYNQFIQRVDEMSSAIKQAYEKLNSGIGNGEFMASNLANIAKAIGSVRDISAEMGKLSVSNDNVGGGTRKISSLIDNIKQAFDSERIDVIKTQISLFKESIETALQTLKDIGAEPIEVDVEAKLSDGFGKSVSKVVREINKGRKRIERAASKGINATIPVSVHFSLRMNSGGVVSAIQQGASAVRTAAQAAQQSVSGVTWGTGGRSGGGYMGRKGTLYRAKGGSIFKPRGTDTIPAMLTEGEFVQNKHATDFWGLDFMRKVNAMDVRGAMQAMMIKAGNSTNIGRQSIFNNTVNNNQRITQNISTNNPNFAGARMSRFVGAL